MSRALQRERKKMSEIPKNIKLPSMKDFRENAFKDTSSKMERVAASAIPPMVVNIEDGIPAHAPAELICIGCWHRAIHIWPGGTLMKTLQCSQCGEIGLLIMTGEGE